jgi:chromosome segregation ATPase
MANSTEIKRLEMIVERISALYGLNVPEQVSKEIDSLTLDIEWLCDRLTKAWSMVTSYQEELRELYNEGN